MRVLITGGTGFIGSRLALRYLRDGYSVRVLGQENNPTEGANRRAIEREGAEVVLGSVTQFELVKDLADDVDIMFHLAAAQHEMNVPDQHFREVNVAGTRNVLEAGASAAVKRIVHGSTIGVYGAAEGPIDETTECRPDNIYGKTKLEGERLALSFVGKVPVVAIRIPEAYGAGDRRLLKLFKAIDRGTFFVIGSGKNLHHPIFIDDLVDGLRSAATVPGAVGEIILLAGKDAVTTTEMVTAVAHALGKKSPRLRAPMFPFAAAATTMEFVLRPLGVQPPLHRRRLDFFRKSFTLSPEKARDLLHFSPSVGFAEGARRTAVWYRESGLL
jgi:nucleoside-diphosphate-sugar epimerase